MIDEPQIFWAVIMSMFIGNLVLLILNLPLIPYIAKVLSIPRNYLIPFILFFTLDGGLHRPKQRDRACCCLWPSGFAQLHYALQTIRLHHCSSVSFWAACWKTTFARSMQLYDGIGFIWERPMTLGLLVIAAVLVVLPSYRARRARLRAQGVADGD